MTANPVKLGEIRYALRLPLLRSALAGVVAVGVLAGFASVSRASCGDWLANSGQPMAGDHGAAGQTGNPGQLPGKAPCKGPYCQNRPAAPAPAPATLLDRIDKIGIALHSELGDLLNGQSALALETDARPSKGFLPRIEHPPRV